MDIKDKVLVRVTIGSIVNIAIGYIVGCVSFTFLVLKLGNFFGVITAWTLSFVVFYTMILFYAWSKKDWIGMEKIKSNLKKEEQKNLLSKLLVYANKRSERLFFIVLSIQLGPFTSFVYMRDPHDYSKMQEKDWKIFLFAYLITNVFCTIVVFTGLYLYKSK